MIHCVATDVNIAADDNISHYLDIEEVEKNGRDADKEEEEEETEDDIVLAIDIAQTPLSPTDDSLSSLFVNTSRGAHLASSLYSTKPISQPFSLPLSQPLSLPLCAVSSSPIQSSSTLSAVSCSTDVEAVSTTSEACVEKLPYLPLSIITERDAEEVEVEIEEEGGHMLQGPFLTAKELSPLSIYLAVKPKKVSPSVCISMPICYSVCVYVRVFVCMFVCVCAFVFAYVFVLVCMCVCTCVSVSICFCIFICMWEGEGVGRVGR